MSSPSEQIENQVMDILYDYNRDRSAALSAADTLATRKAHLACIDAIFQLIKEARLEKELKGDEAK